MTEIINIYCDESGHLLKDNQNIMVIGGVYCQKNKKNEIFKQIRDIKEKHGLKRNAELKWNKVSKSKDAFYCDIVDYFFNNDFLGFRAIFLDKKDIKLYGKNLDEAYYYIYSKMLNRIFESNKQYNIYIDIKDTLGHQKLKNLKQVCNKLQSKAAYNTELVNNIQEVRSHEVELVQLADFLIGAVGYINRQVEDKSNITKLKIAARLKELTGYELTSSTFDKEHKFNLFKLEPDNEGMLWS